MGLDFRLVKMWNFYSGWLWFSSIGCSRLIWFFSLVMLLFLGSGILMMCLLRLGLVLI